MYYGLLVQSILGDKWIAQAKVYATSRRDAIRRFDQSLNNLKAKFRFKDGQYKIARIEWQESWFLDQQFDSLGLVFVRAGDQFSAASPQ